MKRYIKSAVTLFVLGLLFLYGQQSDASTAALQNDLLIFVQNTVSTKCYLSTLIGGKAVLKEQEIDIFLKFDNREMRDFWTSDVAVQYLFDAAVGPLTKAIFSDNRFDSVNTIHFTVMPRPHDWLNDLDHEVSRFDFGLKRVNWDEYTGQAFSLENKAKLYRSMDVQIDYKVLRYNPDEAVRIE